MAITAGYDRMKEVEEFDQSKAGVKGLSDSGASTIPRIFLHPPESLSGLRRTAAAPSPQIPVIDLSGAGLPDHRPEIVRQIRDAASTWGFFQITNHGIPLSTLDATVSAVRAFHELPAEAKSRFYSREETRGVMYASNNDLHRSEAASWHDSIQVWMAPEAPPAMEIPEICREELLAWDTAVKGAGDKVMELLSQGLGLAAGKFEELTFAGSRVVVGHIYPFCPQPDLTLGIKAHTDPGIITIVLQNEVQGLQVRHGEEWVDVKPVPGGLIVNIGDFLQVNTYIYTGNATAPLRKMQKMQFGFINFGGSPTLSI
ncbi:1-aminocyclopropane-1-carboxylate oxidase homolog 4 [Striga hermonthica]|uniref:1-aminocyclopropane-1-carboxylate oxidase homolog 4 n=1 Tax=Striga hermonthica TaxID=68872 RepID=A0A9N7NV50_STRHE|nr:1-aminocyclopropane-1-carboxylate oxidase homolog 4 [Striga hermonthica]